LTGVNGVIGKNLAVRNTVRGLEFAEIVLVTPPDVVRVRVYVSGVVYAFARLLSRRFVS
jgi:hypothetical protein